MQEVLFLSYRTNRLRHAVEARHLLIPEGISKVNRK